MNETLFEKVAALPEGQRGRRQVIDRADTLLGINEYMRELPVYYVLRRTVGETAGHYEYYNCSDTSDGWKEWWTPELTADQLGAKDSMGRAKAYLHEHEVLTGLEILPIRLLVGGVEL